MSERNWELWKQCCRATAKRLPVLTWLPKYSLQWLQLDLMAGLTVGLTVVPQALAYAVVAGLPVQYGLYSSFMGCFIYCFLGTSKDVTLGPTAIMSLLVSSYAFHDPALAILLAFLSGCIQLAMGLLHLGFILDFISYPVIKGFTSAAAVTIGFNQVKALLGLQHIPKQFILQVYYTFCRISETRDRKSPLSVEELASENNYQIDSNQELLAMGALVLLSLAYLTSLFYYIPKAALAAVIICAVAPMFDARIFRTLWQVKRLDLVPLCVTFFVCFWEVQYGIIAGVMVSGILLLYPLARPQIKVVRDKAIVIKPENGLQFPAIDFLRDTVHTQALSESHQCNVILDCSHISSIDYTVVLGLSELLQEFQLRELCLIFIGLKVDVCPGAHVLEIFLAADLKGFRNFSNLNDAEKSLGELHIATEDMLGDNSSILTTTGIIQ
ncbi:Sodium-independent sulfate anion transporter, partial [Ophiophagus hannah]